MWYWNWRISRQNTRRCSHRDDKAVIHYFIAAGKCEIAWSFSAEYKICSQAVMTNFMNVRFQTKYIGMQPLSRWEGSLESCITYCCWKVWISGGLSQQSTRYVLSQLWPALWMFFTNAKLRSQSKKERKKAKKKEQTSVASTRRINARHDASFMTYLIWSHVHLNNVPLYNMGHFLQTWNYLQITRSTTTHAWRKEFEMATSVNRETSISFFTQYQNRVTNKTDNNYNTKGSKIGVPMPDRELINIFMHDYVFVLSSADAWW